MIGVFLFSILVTAKSPEIIVSADTSFGLTFSEGRASFKVFEDRYIDLEISIDPPVAFVVYDEEGNILAKSSNGEAVLNTFFNYWFSVKFSGVSSNSVSVDVRAARDYRQISAIPHTGELEAEKPSEVFTFTPSVSGVYEFAVSSEDRGGDLDLKIYTADDEYISGSFSDGNDERVRVPIFAGDVVRAIVYLNDISKSVNFAVYTARKDDLRELQIGRALSGTVGENTMQNLYLVPSTGSRPVLVYLDANSNTDADLDLYASFGGETYKSVSYTSREMILLPPEAGEVHVTVKGYNLSGSDVRYSLIAQEVATFLPHFSPGLTKRIEPEKPYIFGVTSGDEGFYYFGALSAEKRDIDMMVFDRYGSTELKLNTLNPSEITAIWLGSRDTVYLLPILYDRSSEIEISFGAVDLDTIETIYTGDHINGTVRPPFQGVKFYSLQFPGSGTAAVTVRGESTRDRDVDLFVSGRSFYRRSEGSENPTDMASDETVLFGVESGEYYLAQVYAYGRGDRCRYDISTRLIEDYNLTAENSPGTVRALIIGISGYPGEGSLNRATQDALEFYDLLVLNGIIKPENTVFLADENATRRNILDALARISRVSVPGDKFVFFFSGHGDRKRFSRGTLEQDGYDESICPYSLTDENGDIFDDELSAAIPDHIESYVFLDACHSGGFVSDLTGTGRRLIITASEEDREVGERVLTPLILRAFRGEADRNGDSWLSAKEIIDFVRDRSRRICPECLHEFTGSVPRTCPDCGVSLTDENRPMNPDLGVNFDEDIRLFELKPVSNESQDGGKDKR